MRRMDRSGDGR